MTMVVTMVVSVPVGGPPMTENVETTTGIQLTTTVNQQTSATDSDLSTVTDEVTTVTDSQTQTSMSSRCRVHSLCSTLFWKLLDDGCIVVYRDSGKRAVRMS